MRLRTEGSLRDDVCTKELTSSMVKGEEEPECEWVRPMAADSPATVGDGECEDPSSAPEDPIDKECGCV